MSWDAIGALGEIIGAAAVVASLLYLSIQTKANANATRMNAIYDAETAFAQVNYDHSHDPLFADIVSKAFDPDSKSEDFTETELSQLHFAARGLLQNMQAQWSLWRGGVLETEFWERRRRWTRAFVSLPVIRPMWEAEVAQFLISPEFVRDIEAAAESRQPASLKVGMSA